MKKLFILLLVLCSYYLGHQRSLVVLPENGAESKEVLRKSTDLAFHTERLLWKEDKRLINDNSEDVGRMDV